jgi:hypothetical protein
LDQHDQAGNFKHTYEPVTCQVCLKMAAYPGPREQVPLTGCRRCGDLPGAHLRETNHIYELPTEFQMMVRSSLLYGGGYLVEIPEHPCNGSVKIAGTDEVDRVIVIGRRRVVTQVKVSYEDLTCSFCGALQTRYVLGRDRPPNS